MTRRPKATGDCFQVAGRLATEHRDWLLCHGVVQGQGPLEGRRLWHAWCEYDEVIKLPPVEERPPGFEHLRDTTLTYVVDRSNGNDVTAPAAFYYQVARIHPDKVQRYTWDQARVEMLRHLHWGPWNVSDEERNTP